ncbi:MAG: RNA polymerase sigma factor [Candidatus Aminicenantaceae bacterium]
MSNKMNLTRKMEDIPDDSLVKKAKRGDVEAFTELVRRYQKKIYNTIFQFTRNHLDADDLAQETFMKAFKSLKEFKQKSSFFTWLYRIAVNLSLNFFKKREKEKGRREFLENYSSSEGADFSPASPENYSYKRELEKKVKEAIDTLPLAYKASFILVVFQGMTHAQASQILRCSENTVSWRMHKARKILQNKLKSYF